MEDPTSDLAEDVSPEDAPRCAVCDEPLVETPERRVVTWIDAEEVRTAQFCDETCRGQWEGPDAE